MIINQTITVRMLAVEGAHVKLGMLGPTKVVVVCEELLTPDRQHAHLPFKHAALARETDPRKRTHLRAAVASAHLPVHQVPV